MKKNNIIIASYSSSANSRQCTILKKIVIILLLGVSCIPLHAQYESLPNLTYPLESNYSYQQTQIGNFYNLNYTGSNSEEKTIWSLGMNKQERYRFCQNGTLAFINPAHGTSRIGFYGNDNLAFGYIDSNTTYMRLLSVGTLELFANGTKTLLIYEKGVTSYAPYSYQTKGINVKMTTNASDNGGFFGTTSNHGLYLGTNGFSQFYIDTQQNVYIGMSKEQSDEIKSEFKKNYNLFVAKGILSEDYSISPQSSWSDFVFNKSYNLLNLNDVESFINKNKHLPDVPSAKQVSEEGYSQHDMNKILLQKIEELTLYTIKQEKEIIGLKSELKKINK